jgi:DNA repair exonuclease SbcCD ATPase subunit
VHADRLPDCLPHQVSTRLEGVIEAAAQTEAHLKQSLEEERAASAALAARAEAVHAEARAEIERLRGDCAEIDRLRAAATTFDRQLAALKAQAEERTARSHPETARSHPEPGSSEPGSATSAASASAAASSASALATAHATIRQQEATISALQRRVAEGGGGGGGGEAAALSSVLGGGGAPATGSGGAAPAVAAGVAAAAAAVEAELREEIAFLKHELGELQAALKRSEKGLQLTFLKNVLVRFLKEGDLENALPVLAQGFEFSPQEVKDIRDTRQSGLRGAAARFGFW